MKLTVENNNYCATVVTVTNLNKLDGLDNLLGFPVYGFQCLVNKDIQVGDIGILFTAETQLSPNFCKHNNLYRKGELNVDQTKTGYLEEKGRVKALKLRGHMSTALFLPLSCLDYLGIELDLKPGDTFDHINGVKICEKYIIETLATKRENKVKGKTKKFNRVEAKLFPEHLDTDNYWKNCHKLNDDDDIIVTQKIHGSSGRFAHIPVKRKLNWKEKIAKWFGCKVQETEYDTIAGSRRVVKDIKNSDSFDHYYDVDIWNHHLGLIQHLIPKNFILYGEIVGWSSHNKQIQKNYTYCVPQGKSDFYVYRISVINETGYSVDLTWDQLVDFCKNSGLKYVPEVWRGKHKDFNVDKFIDVKYREQLGLTQCLPLDKESKVDEGVCIRLDGIRPYILKAKSPIFLNHESKMLDDGVSDIESEESVL